MALSKAWKEGWLWHTEYKSFRKKKQDLVPLSSELATKKKNLYLYLLVDVDCPEILHCSLLGIHSTYSTPMVSDLLLSNLCWRSRVRLVLVLCNSDLTNCQWVGCGLSPCWQVYLLGILHIKKNILLTMTYNILSKIVNIKYIQLTTLSKY